MKQKTPEQIKDGIEKVQKAMDRFYRNFNGKMPEELAVTFLVAVIPDRASFLDKLKYRVAEMSINTVAAEKELIYGKLSKDNKIKAKKDYKENKKLILKQIKER